MRSIAALIVVLVHARELLGFFLPRLPFPLSGVLDSKAAVGFFFVLSGFVLHLSFAKTPLSFKSFTGFQVRRVFRIYPLYFLSLLLVLAAIYSQNKQGFPMHAETVGKVLSKNHSDIRQWFEQILLVGPGFDMYFLNPPAWTLAVEMRVAIIFPFLSAIISRLSFRNSILFTFLSLPAAIFAAKFTGLGFLELIPLFIMGAVFAHHRRAVLQMKISMWQMVALTVLSLCFYSLRTSVPALPAVGWYLSALGSLGFLLIALRSQATAKFLLRPSLVFIGEMSYGIYILHFAIFLGLSTQVSRLSPAFLFPLGVCATLALSYVCFRFLEKPFIELGRKLSMRIAKPQEVSSPAAQPAPLDPEPTLQQR